MLRPTGRMGAGWRLNQIQCDHLIKFDRGWQRGGAGGGVFVCIFVVNIACCRLTYSIDVCFGLSLSPLVSLWIKMLNVNAM